MQSYPLWQLPSPFAVQMLAFLITYASPHAAKVAPDPPSSAESSILSHSRWGDLRSELGNQVGLCQASAAPLGVQAASGGGEHRLLFNALAST